jgi:CRP-like cAMP-binding protein
MIDPKLLENMVPVNTISEPNIKKLAERLELEEFPQGTVLCAEGDTDNDAFFLIEGGIELTSHDTTMHRVVQGGTEEASYALAPGRPRPCTVTSTTKIKIIRIDNHSLDRAVMFDELTTTVSRFRNKGGVNLEGDSAWLEQMMGSPFFAKLPPERLSALILKLEPLSVKAGDIIIKQGDPGNYYYVIKEGRFNISSKNKEGKVKILAELFSGNVFGEESLISGKDRNANVIALSEGTLLRLARSDFDKLLKKPMLRHVSFDKATQLANAGAVFLDVRTAKEFVLDSLENSRNIPLASLRSKMNKLDKNLRYIICCQTGTQSEVAAFLLGQNGFDVYVLKGGLQTILKS